MFTPFELERWQSTWENRVKFNLSESGVHPLAIEELLRLSRADASEFLRLRLVYSQSDGTDELRHAIASLYDGAEPDNVVVTIGSAEANFIVCWALVDQATRSPCSRPPTCRRGGWHRTSKRR